MGQQLSNVVAMPDSRARCDRVLGSADVLAFIDCLEGPELAFWACLPMGTQFRFVEFCRRAGHEAAEWMAVLRGMRMGAVDGVNGVVGHPD